MVRSQLIVRITLLAGFCACLASFAFAQPQKKESTDMWAKAEKKVEEHLKGIDPKMRYAEFKSERMSKYLPEFRVFVGFERSTIGESSLFLINQDADTIDLDDSDWHGIAEFLRARKIQVKTADEANEFAKFVVEFQDSQNYVASLHINTKGFTVFDKRFIEAHYGKNASWKYSSEKRDGGWKVTVTYVGDPAASIMMPPSYEIDIDEKGVFRDLRKYP